MNLCENVQHNLFIWHESVVTVRISVSVGFFALLIILLVGFGAGMGTYYYVYYRPLLRSDTNLKEVNQGLYGLINQNNQEIINLKNQVASINQSYYYALNEYWQSQKANAHLKQLILSEVQVDQALDHYYEWKALGLPPKLVGWYGYALSLMPSGVSSYSQASLASAVILSSIDAGNASWAALATAYAGSGSYAQNLALFSNISSWSTPVLTAYDISVLSIEAGNYSQALKNVLSITSALPYSNTTGGQLLSPLEVLVGGNVNQLEVCELAATLLRIEHVNVAIALINNKINPSEYSYELLVQVPNLTRVYYYSGLSNYGIQGGSWAMISPSLSLSSQNSISWANNWALINAEEVK